MRNVGLLLSMLMALACTAQERTASSTGSGGYRISGRVVSSTTGEPVSAARLLLAPTSGAQWAKATLADKDGRFSFSGLKAEKHQLYGERAGYPRQGFDQHDGGYFTAIVTGEGQDTEHLMFRLQPASAIQGVITDEFNEPVRNAQVMIFRRGLREGTFGTYFEGQDQTDDRGFYRFGSLLAGKYFIAATARPWFAQHRGINVPDTSQTTEDRPEHDTEEFQVAFPLTFYPGTTEEADATEIDVRTGQAFNADLSLRSVHSIDLRFLGPEGDQRSVRLSQKAFDFEVQPEGLGIVSSSPGGRGMVGIAPGRYQVSVEIPIEGEATPRRTFFRRGMGRGRAESTRVMDLFSDTSIDLNSFSTGSTASINGLARAEGVTLRNAFVQFRNQETRDVQGAPIDADGKFALADVPPGIYEVSIANSSSVYLANMAASGAKANGRTLEIPNGATVQLAMLLSKGIGEVKGTAMRADKGFAGAMIVLVPENPSSHTALFRRDQSDSDGTFMLRQVVPGKYTVLAIKDGWEMAWSNPAALAPYLAGGTSLEVQPGGKFDVTVKVQQLSK